VVPGPGDVSKNASFITLLIDKRFGFDVTFIRAFNCYLNYFRPMQLNPIVRQNIAGKPIYTFK